MTLQRVPVDALFAEGARRRAIGGAGETAISDRFGKGFEAALTRLAEGLAKPRGQKNRRDDPSGRTRPRGDLGLVQEQSNRFAVANKP